MSGGVDSSVAARLLQEAGHDVIGVFMRHGEAGTGRGEAPTDAPSALPVCQPRGEHKQGCCSATDAADARRVADQLDLPFYTLNLQAEFGRIIEYFVDEYGRGRTPNPCVLCNQWLKFGTLFQYADSVDAAYVATGHYARCVRAADGTIALCRGIDPGKDQSYALFGIHRARLDRMLLPVGDYHKSEIRRRAGELGLRVAAKRDSQEICFVSDGDHGRFVQARRGGATTSGRLVTTEGRVVGQHEGIERFTIGQRKGLGVALGEPYFVVRIDADTRDVVIGRRQELARRSLTAGHTNWLTAPPATPFRCEAQIRYNSRAVPAIARALGDDRLEVVFDAPCHGVAPGQAVVCYDGSRVLGGGWIE
jgi:tRNA-specific 2-thiouridylase